MSKPIAYRFGSSLKLNAAAASDLTFACDNESITITGACPQCHHPLPAYPHPFEVVVGVRSLAETEAVSALQVMRARGVLPRQHEEDVSMPCQCAVEHAKGKVGCGRAWRLNVVCTAGDPTPTVTPSTQRVSPGDLDDEKEIQDLYATELDRVRKAADSWQKGLAGLVALIAGVSIVKGHEKVTELDTTDARRLGALVALSLTLAVAGALLAFWAAYGFPEYRDSSKAHGWEREKARSAQFQLLLSIVLSVVSVFALGAGVLVTWYGAAPKPAAKSEVCAAFTKLSNNLVPSAGSDIAHDVQVLTAQEKACGTAPAP